LRPEARAGCAAWKSTQRPCMINTFLHFSFLVHRTCALQD
jgi:hypothetical protein